MLTEADIDRHLNGLCKPPGSLGRWEKIAGRLCFIQQTLQPTVKPAELIIFSGDHGVVDEGVSLWPSSVTTCMVETIAQGRSVSAVLAAEYGIDWRVVDVGCKFSPRIKHDRLIPANVAKGTKNFARASAMSVTELEQAFQVGREHAQAATERGAKLLIVGEMGIGNTTSAACIAAWLAKVPIDQAVGSGAGATEKSLRKKRQVVSEAVARIKSANDGERLIYNHETKQSIAAVCGFEIAAIAGCMVEAARLKLTILLDGMICTAAALIAEVIEPHVVDWMIAGHQSAEPSHRLMLEHFGLVPILEWEMRLGEGTGALAAYPLLTGACAWVAKTSRIDELSLPEET